MDAQTCLKKLQCVGVLNFSTVGLDGTPQARCISAIHYTSDALYFFTARGKEFCRELLHDGQVQILAYTRYKEMIRVSAKAVPVPEAEQKRCIALIFQEQPYLSNVYPGATREIGIVFVVRDMRIEYFHLGVKPILRVTYTLGKGKHDQQHQKRSCTQCQKLPESRCMPVQWWQHHIKHSEYVQCIYRNQKIYIFLHCLSLAFEFVINISYSGLFVHCFPYKFVFQTTTLALCCANISVTS